MSPVNPQCPICLQHDADESFTKDGFRHFSCRSCRGLYLFPTPSQSELDDYYVAQGEDVWSSQCWERGSPDLLHYEAIWRDALAEIERRVGRGPLLDVGCGGGQFLAFARQQGWEELAGIELSPIAAAAARERSGAVIHSTDFLSSELEPDRFVGVTMWNVIEHSRAPRAFVEEARRLLRPGGVYVADCPNRYGITMRSLGKRAYVVMPPEHLIYFDHRSLRRLLESGGLRVQRLACNTIYINDWVRFLTRPAAEAEARASHLSWYSRATGSRFALGAIRYANLLLNAARLGDQMFVVGQKERS